MKKQSIVKEKKAKKPMRKQRRTKENEIDFFFEKPEQSERASDCANGPARANPS